MADANDINKALSDAMDVLEKNGVAQTYLSAMWRHVIWIWSDCTAEGLPQIRDGSGALPYVPEAVMDMCEGLRTGGAVVDVGCLGGYGLYDLARRYPGRRMAMTGIDRDTSSVTTGVELARTWAPSGNVRFAVGDACGLPLEDECADMVIARLLLPYAPVRRSLSEISRIAKAGGIVLLQTHAFGYYMRQCLRNLRNPRVAIYYARPMFSGTVFGVLGAQPTHRWFVETAMGMRLLTREAKRAGLDCVWTRDDEERPMIACVKRRGVSGAR